MLGIYFAECKIQFNSFNNLFTTHDRKWAGVFTFHQFIENHYHLPHGGALIPSVLSGWTQRCCCFCWFLLNELSVNGSLHPHTGRTPLAGTSCFFSGLQ